MHKIAQNILSNIIRTKGRAPSRPKRVSREIKIYSFQALGSAVPSRARQYNTNLLVRPPVPGDPAARLLLEATLSEYDLSLYIWIALPGDPRGPIIPGAPVSPWAPIGPRSPSLPDGPIDPLSPFSPRSPAIPSFLQQNNLIVVGMYVV